MVPRCHPVLPEQHQHGGRQRRTTVGLNYRPIEATVFKFDYQFNRGSGPAPATADDNAFLFSIASYF